MHSRPALPSAPRFSPHTLAGLGIAALLGMASSSVASAAVFTVGGAGCTHATLIDALAAATSNPGPDEIRLLSGSNHQGQLIIATTQGLTLRGGFASCSATTPTGTSTLLGDNSSRAAFVIASAAMNFENLNVTGGHVTGDGGGIYIQGSAQVFLTNVLVFGNTATGDGGNVYVAASPGLDVVFLGASIISAGSAVQGGGLACSGDGIVRLLQDTVVANNDASLAGGGVFLENSCDLRHGAGGALGGIVTNTAVQNGGGVEIQSGAEMNTGFDGLDLARIQGNQATNGGGGGVSCQGPGSVLRAFFADIADNQAHFFGGGIEAQTGCIVAVGRPFAGNDPCPDPTRCSLLRGNTALAGGAIFAIVDADVTVHGTHIEGNSATVTGSVIDVRQTSTALIHSSVIAENDGPTPFNLEAPGGTLTLGNVTVSRNTNFGPGFVHMGSGAGALRILTSIFDHASGPLVGFAALGSSIQLDCVLARTAAFFGTLPAGTVTRQIMTADPRLANPAGGNYQLKGVSPAIDVCDTTQWNGGEYDIDGQTRDLDQASPNILGSRDLGADEYLHVFADGFENGSTSRWDATIP